MQHISNFPPVQPGTFFLSFELIVQGPSKRRFLRCGCKESPGFSFLSYSSAFLPPPPHLLLRVCSFPGCEQSDTFQRSFKVPFTQLARERAYND